MLSTTPTSQIFSNCPVPNNNPNFENISINLNNNFQHSIQESTESENLEKNLKEGKRQRTFSDCRVCGQQAKCHNFGVKCCHGNKIF